ncbi:hypothetical protein F3Y22_tig00116962pilonHSYRG00463 [Hibiscus syriacus]|uniref:Uncharacterized protein n=1 Tax=Hibiscus syriacus TaxID=106335 RepID=A0A6A2XM36_HIBSY|nr:hypothetical protein F3Y22_tig00116962pilonHSYRG00463 [Hibiscus syriacus]
METSKEKEERKRRNAEKGLNRMSQIRSTRPQDHHPTPSSADVKKESFDARDRLAFFTDDDQSPETNQSDQTSAAPVGLSEASTSSTLKQGSMHEISSTNSQDDGSQAQLLNQGTGVSGEAEEEKPEASQENKENWDATVVLVERGLVAYQTIRATFTDFSIYAVVVICGTSIL